MYTKLSKILNDLETFLVPLRCFGCNAYLYRGERFLCAFCRHELPLAEYGFDEESPVDRLFYGRIRVEKTYFLLHYAHEGMVKKLIHELKYRGQQQIGTFLGDWVGERLVSEGKIQQVDWVFPVPLHPRKKRKRGYNQCTRFARAIARHLGARYSEKHLVRTANTHSQTARSRLERWEGVSGCFELRNPSELEGCSILLADDVITTGATLEACGQTFSCLQQKTLFLAAAAAVP